MRDKKGRFIKGYSMNVKENNPNWTGGKPKCEVCGKIISYGCKRCRGHMIRVFKPETLKRLSESRKEEKNVNWKGDKVKYGSLHDWIRSHKPKPELCEKCKINKPYDLANISGEYKRDINDYEWLCRKCHMESDGRVNNRNNFGQFCGTRLVGR